MRALILLTLIAGSFSLNAQQRSNQYGIGAQPFYSQALWIEEVERVDAQPMKQSGLAGVSPQIWFLKELKNFNYLQFGLSYSLTGFVRRAEDIKRGISYHPDFPVRTDNSQGDPVHIDFYYRHHYICLPFFYNMEVKELRKSISLHYYFSPGLSIGYNVYDKTIAKTRGFGLDRKNRFALNNQYDVNPIIIQLHLAGRAEYQLDNRYKAHIQPVINMPITSVFRGGDKALVPSVGVNLFVSMLPNVKKEVE